MKKPAGEVPIPVRAVDFVMYCADDPVKTRAWYRRMFGLKPGDEWSRFWSEFDTEPVALCINGPNTSDDEAWTWRGPASVALAVDDIHGAAAQCRRRKVTILQGPVETSVCWMLFILDPEGNRLVLHQRKDGTAG